MGPGAKECERPSRSCKRQGNALTTSPSWGNAVLATPGTQLRDARVHLPSDLKESKGVLL